MTYQTLAKSSLMLGCLVCGACVQHQARLLPPAPDSGDQQLLTEKKQVEQWQHEEVEQSPLPLETQLTAYALRDGQMHRADHTLQTPVPWWQAFPADIVTDLFWPGTLLVEAEQRVELSAVPLLKEEDLDNAARSFGYAEHTGAHLSNGTAPESGDSIPAKEAQDGE